MKLLNEKEFKKYIEENFERIYEADVSYIRKSDSQKFSYKIKFDGNKILWANIDGRWRNSEYD